MPLKSRQVQIPGGLKYLQSETQFQTQRYSSFDEIVDQVIAHRQANPYLVQKNGWTTDRATVEIEVDNYNCNFCRQMGGQYLAYIDGGPAPADSFPPGHPLTLIDRARAVAAGAKVLVEWLKDGEAPVHPDVSNARAGVCAKCPLNNKGDWTGLFTAPVASAIHKELERRKAMSLSTRFDSQLGICSACFCPMKLKVHCPLPLILSHLEPDIKSALHPNCWVLAEEKPAA